MYENKIIERPFISIHDLQTQVRDLIKNKQLNQADAEVQRFSAHSNVEKRIQEHLIGLINEYSENLDGAHTHYLIALEKYGENVNLIRDLASIYYQFDIPSRWRYYYQLLKKNLSLFDHVLSTESKVSCSFSLAKFIEEDGDLVNALTLYEECFELTQNIESETRRIELSAPILPQIVRLKAQFNQGASIGSYYSQLISINRKNCNPMADFEIQHSLMLAELYLIGSQHAWSRAKALLDDKKFSAWEHRLIYFDLIEETLIRKLILPEDIDNYKYLTEQANTYEREIARITFEPHKECDLIELSHLASSLSWSCYLRILILHFSRTKDKNLAEEIKNKIILILSSLPSEARIFWMSRMKPYLATEDFVIGFSRENRTVNYQNKKVDLSRKKGMLIILEALANNPENSIDDIIKLLWNCDYSPENHHRLRMTVHRLNQILFDLTTVSKVLELSSDRLSLKPSINIEYQVDSK